MSNSWSKDLRLGFGDDPPKRQSTSSPLRAMGFSSFVIRHLGLDINSLSKPTPQLVKPNLRMFCSVAAQVVYQKVLALGREDIGIQGRVLETISPEIVSVCFWA
jgi:hypothetical protein